MNLSSILTKLLLVIFINWDTSVSETKELKVIYKYAGNTFIGVIIQRMAEDSVTTLQKCSK